MKRLLILVLSMVSATAIAETGRYGVEVIIFRNLGTLTEGVEARELRSFSQFPDLGELTQAKGSLIAGNSLPDDLRIIFEKSARMDEVWKRLQFSNEYQPLIYAGWEQNRVDYYPPMRIHDQEIIATQLRLPTHIMVADLLAADFGGGNLPPQYLAAEDLLANYQHTFYQLDGSVQLRRSRFLHLFLDLEIRAKESQPEATPVFRREIDIQLENGADDSYLFNVMSLKQNRQIRTGELQYFDTPGFGALVFVIAIPAT
jgi:hypothetical protein